MNFFLLFSGGQFTPASSGQFGPAEHGQLKPANSGQFHRRIQLYAKYLICSNGIYSQDKLVDTNPLKCQNKKILFIDDQADEGWSLLMANIFQSAGNGFVTVDSSKYKNQETKLFHDFEGFLTECRNHIGKDWDLIVVDLRLYPEKEDIDFKMIPPTDFSGYRLIDDFLNENEGYQIIVSTASNKIWNINAALKRGASSYYIKESPEFNYSIQDTQQHYENFKGDVLKCFARVFLKEFYKKKKYIKSTLKKSLWDGSLDVDEQLEIEGFQGLAISLLDAAFENLRNIDIDTTGNKFRLSFLLLYQIIEEYIKLKSIYLEGDKKSSSKVFRKDRTNVDCFGPDKMLAGNIKCNIVLKKGCFPYQSNKSDKTIRYVIFQRDTFNPRTNPKSQVSETPLFKIINVYKERHLYTESQCNKLIELTYLRSNLCGHITGNIDTTIRDITKDDILDMINEIETIVQ